MEHTLLSPAIFYFFIVVITICLHKHGGLKKIISDFETLKYPFGTIVFYFININALFYCSFCNHCHKMCIPFTMSGVIIGSVVYLSHLGKQTQFNIKRIVSGEKFDMMAPFFAVPYFYMIYEIGYATFNTGLESLHAFEGKMIIVLLYPFYLALGELTSQIGKLKSDSEIKPKQ